MFSDKKYLESLLDSSYLTNNGTKAALKRAIERCEIEEFTIRQNPKSCISVEFLAGTSLSDSILEAKRLAVKFNVAYVKFKINDIDFSIGRKGNLNDCLKSYKQNKTFIISP